MFKLLLKVKKKARKYLIDLYIEKEDKTMDYIRFLLKIIFQIC